MITGNMARDNWYQPGALLTDSSYQADIEGADDFTTGFTAGTLITKNAKNLQISYTPPVDAIALVSMAVMWKVSADGLNPAFYILQNATQVAYWADAPGVKATWYSATLTAASLAMAANTAYTFYGYCINPTANILTIANDLPYTKLYLMVWRHP